MKKTDTVYLEDIQEMIQKIQIFVEGVNFPQFEQDEEKQFAVFHALEVIGEAAGKLSAEFCIKHHDFPAREAVELRNILIHGYDTIRLDIVWKTIHENLQPLLDQIKTILSSS